MSLLLSTVVSAGVCGGILDVPPFFHRGQRRWQKESGYRRQARVENAFFRYKSINRGGTSSE